MGRMCECRGGIVEARNANFYGNGTQTLVLADGFGTDQTVWHYLIPYLACYFKVLVFDLAFSPNVSSQVYDPSKYATFDAYAQDLVCLLDQLNLNKTVYIGHSMSAMTGCLAATKRPELFEHLILISGSPRYLNAKGYEGGFTRSELNSIIKAMSQNFSNWAHSFSQIAVGVRKFAAIAKFEYSLRRMKPKIALSVARTVFLSDMRWVLPRVTVPCTIIQSRKDYIGTKICCILRQETFGFSLQGQDSKDTRSFSSARSLPFAIEGSEGFTVCGVIIEKLQSKCDCRTTVQGDT